MNRQWDIGDLFLMLLIGGYFLFIVGAVFNNLAIAVLGVLVVVLLLIALVLVTLQDFDIIDIGEMLEQRRQRMREYHVYDYEPIPEGVSYGRQENYDEYDEPEQEQEKDMEFHLGSLTVGNSKKKQSDDDHRFYFGW